MDIKRTSIFDYRDIPMLMRLFVFILLLHGFTSLQAIDSRTLTPFGRWITYDETKSPAGIVEIYPQNGKLYGKIIGGFGPDQLETCQNCTGMFKNQPVHGLTFMWDFIPQHHNTWAHGYILDPRKGGIYQGSLALINEGKQLQIRGYWGIFWQTRVWDRVI